MDERRKQLRRDMDQYISQRRKGEGWGLFKKQAQPALHPTVQPYKKEGPMEQSPADTEYEQSRKGWFSGFMGKLFGEEQPVHDISQEQVQSQLIPGHEGLSTT